MKTETQQPSSSEILAAFAAKLRYEDIPPEVVAKVKTHILDAIGVGMAGSTMEWCRQSCRVFERAGAPTEATVLGQSHKLAAPDAALANGVALGCMDYDDTDYTGGGHHMSRHIIAAALAAGELTHSSGKELITAVTIGYEVASRVGSSLLLDRYGPRGANSSWTEEDFAKHHKLQKQGGSLVRGNIPGLFACTTLASRLLGLSAAQISSAQGLVGGFGLFLCQSHSEGADATMLFSGWSAHAGVLSALWAREGLRGPRHIYEGKRGLLEVIGGDLQDATQLTDRLGTQWNSMNNLLKFYPGGHGMHHFIESLHALMNEGLGAQDIEQIECHAPSQRIEFHFEPKEDKLHPTPYSARFSLPYVLARLAIDRALGPLSYAADKVTDPVVIELASRITYVADETVWIGDKRGLVIVKLRDGRVLKRSSPELRGFPNRPFTRDDIVGKFKENANLIKTSPRRIDSLVQSLEALENVKDIGDVMRFTTPA